MPKADTHRVWHRSAGAGFGLVVVTVFGAAISSGCIAMETGGSPEDGAPVDVAALAEPVVGGETAEACQWPSTVSVNAWGSCSGTLIHPRVVTTAAHCIQDGKSTIYFGAKSTPGAFSLEARCEVGAQGSRGANSSRDWAYCVLPEDDRVKEIPVTPPLVGCEAEKFLKPGGTAWVVGFGTTSALGQGAGTKRQVSVVINALNKAAQGTIDVGDAEQGACHGDSGGPLYVHLTDGEHDYGYRVVGSTSGAGARFCDCSCSTVYVNIENHVKAIEEQEHIDVTPCTDADGNFEPSPECEALLTSPQDGSGSFPGCSVARTVEPINSCGALVIAPTAGTSGGAAGSSGAGGAAPALGAAGAVGQVANAGAAAPSDTAGSASPAATAPQAGASGTLVAPSAPSVTPAVAAPSAPAAAVQPSATSVTSGVAAAGRPGVASAAFSSTAAGAPAAQPIDPTSSSSGCQVTGPRGELAPAWLVISGFCVLSWRRARRPRPSPGATRS